MGAFSAQSIPPFSVSLLSLSGCGSVALALSHPSPDPSPRGEREAMDDRAVLADVQHVAQFPDFAAASYASVALPAAGPGELVLSVESFALSGNNLSYAAAGGALGGCAYTHTHARARAHTHTPHARTRSRAPQAAVQDYPPARGQGWRVNALIAARRVWPRRQVVPARRGGGGCRVRERCQSAASARLGHRHSALSRGGTGGPRWVRGALLWVRSPPSLYHPSLSPSLPLPPSLPLSLCVRVCELAICWSEQLHADVQVRRAEAGGARAAHWLRRERPTPRESLRC